MAVVRRWFRLVVGCGLLVTAYFVVPVTAEERTGSTLLRDTGSVLAIVLMAVFLTLQMRRQLDAGESTRTDGLVFAVVATVIGFAFVYYALAHQQTGEFDGLETRIDALYFTLSTLATVGYDDIHATGQFARFLVIVQMAFSLLLLTAAATLLTSRWRVAAAERAHHRRESHPVTWLDPDSETPGDGQAGDDTGAVSP